MGHALGQFRPGSGDYPSIVDALIGNEDFDEAFGSWFDEVFDSAEDDDDDYYYGDDYFVCANLNEIPRYWVEDGYDDCGDNSDEEFVCDDGEVLNGWDVNDGYEDCMGGEDETYERPVQISIYMDDADESEMDFEYYVSDMDAMKITKSLGL